jgi:hypothetical protein
MRAGSNRTSLALVGAALCITACSAQLKGAPKGGQTVVVQRIDGPYVLSGTDFDVALEEPLGTRVTRPGDAFVARLTKPLRAPFGAEVVPAGSRVTGRVIASLDSGRNALAVKFETIDTVRGPANLHATIQCARPYASVALVPPRPPPEFDAVLLPASRPAIGGGPPSEPGSDQPINVPVRVPSSATVRLVLTDNLVPPGVRIETTSPEENPLRPNTFPPAITYHP